MKITWKNENVVSLTNRLGHYSLTRNQCMRSHDCCSQKYRWVDIKNGQAFPQANSSGFYIIFYAVTVYCSLRNFSKDNICWPSGIVSVILQTFQISARTESFLRGMHEQFTRKCITGDHSIDMLNPEFPVFVGQTFKWASCNFTQSWGFIPQSSSAHTSFSLSSLIFLRRKKNDALYYGFVSFLHFFLGFLTGGLLFKQNKVVFQFPNS